MKGHEVECLNELNLLYEAHLRLTVREYVAHYNRERPHLVKQDSASALTLEPNRHAVAIFV